MTADARGLGSRGTDPWIPVQKLHLILSHLYLLPWLVRRSFGCELPLRPFLDANPDLKLGGLPIASKLSRYGTDAPYLPTLVVDATTKRSELGAFVADHSFPLVLKPLFGAHSRDVRRVFTFEEIISVRTDEPMILQPYVDTPKEYGINVVRVGARVKIYGLTEVTLRAVWGDGRQSVRELAAERYGPEVADQLDEGDTVPPKGHHVPLQIASGLEGGSSFRDVTDEVTPELRAACQGAANQIGLRFGRFDVKAESLQSLREGDFYVLEVNGSPSLDLTLYDENHSLSVKIERLRAHWEQFFQQARAYQSSEQNSWRLLTTLLWFSLSPRRCVTSFGNKVDNGELAPST